MKLSDTDKTANRQRQQAELQKKVFEAIVNERRWQDQNIKHFKDAENEHSIAEYTLLIGKSADYAFDAYAEHGAEGAKDQIRQIAALCVRAMEEHGVCERSW